MANMIYYYDIIEIIPSLVGVNVGASTSYGNLLFIFTPTLFTLSSLFYLSHIHYTLPSHHLHPFPAVQLLGLRQAYEAREAG